MKKLICILLAVFLFCGCTPVTDAPETTPPATTVAATSAPAESVPPVETTAPTEPQWTGYSGTSRGYIYLHPEGRDHDWEEDILYFGNSYLDNYAQLTHFPSRVEFVNDVEYVTDLYDPELREHFISEINTLIARIPDLTDTQILYELQRIVALLRDGHASLILDYGKIFPIGFELFYEEEVLNYRVTFVPSRCSDALFAKLTGVNGIALEEVIDLLRPYISYENAYWLSYLIGGGSYPGYIAQLDLLRHVGILDESTDTITYNLISESGETIDITLRAYYAAQLMLCDPVMHTHEMAYPEIYGDYSTYYFHQFYSAYSMIYVRVNQFEMSYDYTFMDFGNQIIKEVREAGGVKKLVIDLRRNPGGSQFYGYVEFINALKRMDIEDIYVLVDEGTFSCGILMASTVKYTFPEAIIVGTPAGQPPNFYASMWDGDYVMPNCDVVCRMPTAYHNIIPDYEYDALMPDLIVYPTLRDYKRGIDTILEAVKGQ